MEYAITAHRYRRPLVLVLLSFSLAIAITGCAWVDSLQGGSPYPDDDKASLVAEAQRFYDSGQFQRAIEIWEQVPPTDPRYIDAQFGIREARLQIEDLQEEQVMSVQVRSKIDALISQAEELEQQGNLHDAVQIYEQARQYDPKNISLYNKIEELHALLDNTLERYTRLGDIYLAQGQYEKSKAEWERLLLLDPANEKAKQRLADIEVLTASSDTVFVKRGRSLFNRGFINAAKEEFEKARRINPSNELIQTYLTQLANVPFTEYRVQEGDTLSSIAVKYSGKASFFQILADFNNIDVNTPLKIGQRIKIPHVLDFKKSLAPDGTDIFLEAPSTSRNNQTAPRSASSDISSRAENEIDLEQTLKEGLFAFQEGNYRQAISLLQQVLLQDPENEEAYEYFVTATEYVRRGISPNTRAVLVTPEDTAREETPDQPELSEAQRLMNTALAKREAGELREAIATFEQAYQLDPTTPGVLEDLEETRDQLKQQITSYLNEGIKHFNQDSLEEAILAWNKVLELDPSNRQAAEYKERAETLLKTFSPQ